MRKLLIFCFLLLVAFNTNVNAQAITVTSHIDSTTMWIGNQTRLSFEVSQQPGQIVTMPIFSDTIIGGLEVVEPVKFDTVTSPDGVLLVTQSYVVTAFEDSLMYIPSYPFSVGNDTVWSKTLSLKVVQPFVIDTTSNQIADIKNVYTPKFYWKGILKIALIVLLLLIVIIASFFIIRRLLQKKPIFFIEPSGPAIPPYTKALLELDRIKQEKAWQTGRTKEYHTALTDVLRQYIEETFDIPCMEMTSEEVFNALHHLRFESKTSYNSLQQILKLADLVKFAKWEAGIEEHELSLSNAYLFVNQTKIETPIDTEEVKEELENVNAKTEI